MDVEHDEDGVVVDDRDDVTRIVTSRFLNLYGAPNATDPKAFADEYKRALAGTDPDLLQEATDQVISSHDYPTWPTIGECKKTVAKVAEMRLADKKRKGAFPGRPRMPWDDHADRAAEWARDYCKTNAFGQEAWRKGFGRAIYDIVRSNIRECYRLGAPLPDMDRYRPRQDVIDYYARYCVDSPGAVALDRHTLLGEPLPNPTPVPEGGDVLAHCFAIMKSKGGFSLAKERAKWDAHQRARAQGRPRATNAELAAAAGESAPVVRGPDVSRPAWEARYGSSEPQVKTGVYAPDYSAF